MLCCLLVLFVFAVNYNFYKCVGNDSDIFTRVESRAE